MRRAVPLPSMRVAIALLVATAIALALVVLAGVASPKPAEAAPPTVTLNLSNTGQITIPSGSGAYAASPYPSEINATSFGLRGKIIDVNLTLNNYSHTWPDDVEVLLVHPKGNRTVMSDSGGANAVSNISIGLDDEAADSLPNHTQLSSGTYKPTNNLGDSDFFPAPAPSPFNPEAALSGFDGLNPFVTWKLYVVDDFSDTHVGSFGGGWSLEIEARKTK